MSHAIGVLACIGCLACACAAAQQAAGAHAAARPGHDDERIAGEDPYKTPMRIYPATHYTMGGLWVDYE
jgi:hypothetical protein